MKNNIILFGFMGCGKSTVGALLAQMTNRPLLDTDAYLEHKYGRAIPDIFASDGEAAFREMERAVCAEMAGQTGLILCCGGGTVLDGENAKILAQTGEMVFLKADFDVCYERIRQSNRPLVRQNTKEALLEIFRQREPVYQSRASLVADAALPPRQAALSVLGALNRK
ncbi:MAG: shikimate kinase [Oscillospiraceae bacterium]|nr:shikimate kinase [Oscillospiraceae bacterium]